MVAVVCSAHVAFELSGWGQVDVGSRPSRDFKTACPYADMDARSTHNGPLQYLRINDESTGYSPRGIVKLKVSPLLITSACILIRPS